MAKKWFLPCLIFSLLALASCSAPAAPPAPTETPVPPTATVVPTATTRILTFFIAGGDKGRSGKAVGCNDSVIPVAWDIPPTQDPLRAALEKLFEFKDQLVGPIRLYNALYQSDLVLERYDADENGVYTVYLSGRYMLGGVCDNPRFQAQIEETILQFPEVKEARIMINDTPLSDILSGK
jgi:hypothetical protein